MGIFSRFTDIINANINALLDKAEDPKKMIRLIIQEMEDTLVEVRAESARTIAEKKQLERKCRYLEEEAASWEAKAELAVRKGREDLAKAALLEKRQCLQDKEVLERELAQLDEALSRLTEEISALQKKLDETRARQEALLMRHQTSSNRIRVREKLVNDNRDKLWQRFERFEQKLDTLDATIEAQDIGRARSLKDEFASLEAEDLLEEELAQLKQRVKGHDKHSDSNK